MRTIAYDGPTIVHVHSAAGEGSEPIDAIVQITATRMWADDLALHEGRLDYAEGALLRHESLADVLEVGDQSSVAKVGDVLYLRLNVACGHCEHCERGETRHCLTAQPGSAGEGPTDLTAGAWSVRTPELDNAWQRITRLLQEHPTGMHSAPLSRSVLTAIGSQVPSGDEPPPDYRHFDRWDDGWAAVVLRPE